MMRCTHCLSRSSRAPRPAAWGCAAATQLCRSRRNQPVHKSGLWTKSSVKIWRVSTHRRGLNNNLLKAWKTLTVLDEDVDRLLGQTVSDDVLVGLHHVGAEDPLVVSFSHVGSGRSRVTFQQVGAAFLRGKHSRSESHDDGSALSCWIMGNSLILSSHLQVFFTWLHINVIPTLNKQKEIHEASIADYFQ